MNTLIATGLFYDIVGVCILALALMAIRTWDLYSQAGTYYGGNKLLFKTLLLQRTDAQFGLPFLVAGFAFQLAGAVGLDVPR